MPAAEGVKGDTPHAGTVLVQPHTSRMRLARMDAGLWRVDRAVEEALELGGYRLPYELNLSDVERRQVSVVPVVRREGGVDAVLEGRVGHGRTLDAKRPRHQCTGDAIGGLTSGQACTPATARTSSISSREVSCPDSTAYLIAGPSPSMTPSSSP
jgi:hypothetical protein